MKLHKSNNITFSVVNTKKCNFSCTYCYENGQFENKEMSKENIDIFVSFLDQHREIIPSLTFIGGEPTLAKNNKYFFNKILEKNLEIEEIRIITNGSNYDLIIDMFSDEFLDKYKDFIIIQVSYDGKAIHDKDRLIKKGNTLIGTSEMVLETIDKIFLSGFRVNIKPTLNFKYFDLVPEVLREFRELNLKYKDKLNDFKKGCLFSYEVTEVKESIEILTEEEIKEKIDNTIKEIMKEEIINKKILNNYLTRWFNINMDEQGYSDAPACHAGINYFGINKDLDISMCHHSDYLGIDKERNHTIYGNLKDDVSIWDTKVLENRNKIEDLKEDQIIPLECQKCEAIYCVKCPIEKYQSDMRLGKIHDIANYYDSFNNKNVCFYFKYISKFIHYFNKKIKGEINVKKM